MQGTRFGALLAPFRLEIWTGPFPVGDMDCPLFNIGTYHLNNQNETYKHSYPNWDLA